MLHNTYTIRRHIETTKKKPKKAPQKTGDGSMKRFAWDSGETSNFSNGGHEMRCLCRKMRYQRNGDTRGPVKGGVGGFPNDFFKVMQGSIYADILCMALACRMYHDIYKLTMRARLSEEIRHAVSARAKALPRRILLSFAPSAAAGWQASVQQMVQR